MSVDKTTDVLDDGAVKVTLDAGEQIIPGYPEAKEAFDNVGVEQVVYSPFLIAGGIEDGMRAVVLKFESPEELDNASEAAKDYARSLFDSGVPRDAQNVEEFSELLPSSSEIQEGEA